MPFAGSLESLVLEQLDRRSVPGVAIGIFHRGAYEYLSYGIANIETGLPVAPETLFQIGSVSKIFTTTLVLHLVDEGMLDLDAPVIDYVPDLGLSDPCARRNLTLRHLLTHRGGFYGDRFDDHGDGDDALAKAVRAFHDLPQYAAPGELWAYSNAGFDLAGRAVENVLDMTFEQAVRERIFLPLGMTRSTFFASEAIRHSVAVGHLEGGEQGIRVAAPFQIPRRANPAGGIISNVAEVLRFARLHIGDGEFDGVRILKPETARMMRQLHTEADFTRRWGLGWSLREINGVRAVEHVGSTNGFMGRLCVIPERDFALTILTNAETGGSVHSAIYAHILQQVVGFRRNPPAPVVLDRAQLARFEGHFFTGLADILIELNGSGLVMHRMNIDPFTREITERPPARLSPISETIFAIEEGPLSGGFGELILNEDGSVRFLRAGGRLGRLIPGDGLEL
ncbi:MAG: beta-lactamase family protein [Thermomicrobiales bacterium]|nr:beta-lactamase family protein [Thermomicrobiales bacterium]